MKSIYLLLASTLFCNAQLDNPQHNGMDKVAEKSSVGKTIIEGEKLPFNKNSAVTIYVSPLGNDANSGTLESPLKSITAARNLVREQKKRTQDKDIQVYLRGGQYRLQQTLRFGLEDGGSESQSITYSSYPGETAQINGSIPIATWSSLPADAALPKRIEHLREKIWIYTDPRIKNGNRKVYSLFKDGRMLPRSRQGFAYDNPFYKTKTRSSTAPKFRQLTEKEFSENDYLSKNRKELLQKGVKGKGRFGCNELCSYLFYPEGAIKNWENLDDIELFLYTRAEWLHEIRGIKAIDPIERRAFFDFPTKFSTEARLWRKNHPDKYPHEFYVENALDYMDEVGEWCVNSKTGTLYLLSDEKPKNIELPLLTELVLVEGHVEGVSKHAYQPDFTDKPVRFLNFKNLHFTRANGYRERQANYYTHVAYDLYDAASAMLRFRGTENCRIEACHFSNAGSGGIRLDLHAQHNQVKNNHLHDLGRAGITLIGYTPGTKDVNKHNLVYNNHIYQVGQIQLSSVGIGIIQSGHNHIAHNLVHDFPFMGIATLGHWRHIAQSALKGQLWSEQDGYQRPAYSAILRKPELQKGSSHFYDYVHSRKNLIEYNELYNGCYALGDINPMYINTCGGKNLIRRNLVHHSSSHSHVGTAYRTDEGSIDNIMEENIAYNCAGGFVVKSIGNRYTNNFLVSDQENFNGRHGMFKILVHREKELFKSSAHKNVFYTHAPLMTRDVPYPTQRKWFPLYSFHLSGRNLELINTYEARQNPAAIDHNVFFSNRGYPGKLPAILGPNSECANPQFKDIKNFDFTIQNKALLNKHQIKQIDASQIGLTKEFPDKYRTYQGTNGKKQTARVSRSTKQLE